MRNHNLQIRSLLRAAVSSVLGIAMLVLLTVPSPLHGQSVSPPSCALVVERGPATSNVVWGNSAPRTLDDACIADVPDDPTATGCVAIGDELEWFWDVAALEFLEAVDWCCNGCPDVQERDGEPANIPD
jgi:hypothetical protein